MPSWIMRLRISSRLDILFLYFSDSLLNLTLVTEVVENEHSENQPWEQGRKTQVNHDSLIDPG